MECTINCTHCKKSFSFDTEHIPDTNKILRNILHALDEGESPKRYIINCLHCQKINMVEFKQKE